MERTLRNAGYVVRGASSALDALELLSALSSPPAAIVSDLRMDPIDGASLGRMVRAQWPGIPLLFVSGSGPGDQYGNVPGALLPKPFDPKRLAEAVDRLVSPPRAERFPS
jgi:two-component system, cell cycle sensor histidine kinase and response regulator CckA